MSYGFGCGYCRESVDTPFADARQAEMFASALGWRLTLGHTDAWGGTAHNTCPYCAAGSRDALLLCDVPMRKIVTGLALDCVEAN